MGMGFGDAIRDGATSGAGNSPKSFSTGPNKGIGESATVQLQIM